MQTYGGKSMAFNIAHKLIFPNRQILFPNDCFDSFNGFIINLLKPITNRDFILIFGKTIFFASFAACTFVNESFCNAIISIPALQNVTLPSNLQSVLYYQTLLNHHSKSYHLYRAEDSGKMTYVIGK